MAAMMLKGDVDGGGEGGGGGGGKEPTTYLMTNDQH